MRVIRNALAAPARASAVSHSWPIRKYEHRPMTSQPTSSTHRFVVPDDRDHRDAGTG